MERVRPGTRIARNSPRTTDQVRGASGLLALLATAQLPRLVRAGGAAGADANWSEEVCGAYIKEVIQPHLPVQLPCYDFTPVIDHSLDACHAPKRTAPDGFNCNPLPWCDGRCVQGPGTYSPRYADPRLLAIPTSRSRVADSDLNWGRLSAIRSPSRAGCALYRPL